MAVEAILATVAELGERHELLMVDERDGVDIVRCEAAATRSWSGRESRPALPAHSTGISSSQTGQW
jgi:hypothetical protein